MLAPQSKPVHINSSNKLPSKQKYCFLMKTCSSSALRSAAFQKQQPSDLEEQRPNYSKLLKQRDLKILNLMEKVRIIESELSFYKNSHQTLQNDLQFFKSKIQEQFYRNVCMQSQIEIINTTMKTFIIKIINLFQGNERSMQSFAKHLQSLKVDNTETDNLDISKKLLSSLDFQIAELTKSFYLLKKEPEVQKSLIRSADLRFQSYKLADQIEKQALRSHINNLMNYYETKSIDFDDYKQQIQNLRRQRQFMKDLLLESEKQKNGFVNDIYQISRREYQIDFERMSKSEVVKLCISLLAKVKDLQNECSHLDKQLAKIQVHDKIKYQNMYKQVKKIEKISDQKLSIKRMSSVPYL